MDLKNKRFGLQKMTLLDYPGRVACTVFSHGCNFRCPFCHNAMLVLPDGDRSGLFTGEEILTFLKKRQGLLDGVCFTGGEPLLGDGIFEMLRAVRNLGYRIKVDTNGSFPDRLQRLLEADLTDYVAMDIKNSPEKYAETVGNVPGFSLDAVRNSVELLRNSRIDHEFRTTVAHPFHTPEDFEAVGQWLQGAPRYFLQKFTEHGELLGDMPDMGALSDELMHACLETVKPYIPAAELRGM